MVVLYLDTFAVHGDTNCLKKVLQPTIKVHLGDMGGDVVLKHWFGVQNSLGFQQLYW